MIAERMLVASDVHGVHIPKVVISNWGAQMSNVSKEDRATLLADHEAENYDDVWDDVLKKAKVTIIERGKKYVYTLHQDGSVWLVPDKSCVEWKPDGGVILDSNALHDMFDETLNEANGLVNIGSREYEPSTVLKSVDQVAYRESYNDWLDGEVADDNLYEYNDEYSDEDIEEPEDYYEAMMDGCDGLNGRYEWKTLHLTYDDDRLIPSHETMENH